MTATATAGDFLGIGVYTIAEAAAYARMHPTTLSCWLGISPDHERVLRPEFPNAAEKFVTFLDFVQALAVRAVRTEMKIPLQKIRDAVNKARDEFHVEFPMARKHLTYVYGKELYIFVPTNDGDDSKYVQATGKAKNQIALKPIIELYMKDIVKWTEEGLAAEYRAFQWAGHDIVMNPQRRFGEPVVLSCGYTALVLYEACKSEGSFSAAADAYGVQSEEVEAAFRYYDFLDARAAA